MENTRIYRRPRRPFATLRVYFDQTGTKQADIAADVGISEAHMSNIISGRRKPSVDLACKISALTNVPVEAIAQVQLG
jgi:DNA-binding XRE family transcriptional regulator